MEYNIPDTDGLGGRMGKKKEIRYHFYSFTGQTRLQKIYVRYYRRVNKFGRLVASRIARFHIIFQFETKMWHKKWCKCTATFTPVSWKTPVPAPWFGLWYCVNSKNQI